MSLLRYQFSNIKKGNPNSRILVMTHDLRSVFDLIKVRSELNGGNGTYNKYMELLDKHLIERKVSSEYKRLLEFVYEYAKNANDDAGDQVESSIGNVMRRVVEAFRVFAII